VRGWNKPELGLDRIWCNVNLKKLDLADFRELEIFGSKISRVQSDWDSNPQRTHRSRQQIQSLQNSENCMNMHSSPTCMINPTALNQAILGIRSVCIWQLPILSTSAQICKIIFWRQYFSFFYSFRSYSSRWWFWNITNSNIRFDRNF
jgi:hypothetical protein